MSETSGADESSADEISAEGRLPIARGMVSARHALRILGKRRGSLALSTALLLASSGAALLVPPALGWIVDAVVERVPLSTVALAATVVIASGVLSAVLARTGGRLLASTLQTSLAELREEVFTAAMRLDRETVEAAGSSDVVSRVTADVEAITAAVSDVLPRFIGAGFTIALTVVGLTLLDPWLALAALTAVPVQLFAIRRFMRRSRPLYRRLRLEESERGQAIIEAVAGADTIIASGAGEAHLERVAVRSLRAVETEREATRARNRFNAGLNAAEFIGLAAVLATGYWQATTAGLTVGSVTAAALFFHRLFAPIGALLSSIDDLQRAGAGLGRLVGVLQAVPERTPRRSIVDASVLMRSLRYRYRGAARDALVSTDLRLPPGSTTVLVGVSGSGKSTLAQLIAGVLLPTGGEVLIGGVPAAGADLCGRRAAFLVTQDAHLFAGTLADNLRLAAPAATDAELWRALDIVSASWARELSYGLDTPLGHDLDDSRIQEIALARVLLADPPVVVLDEATAHGGADGTLDRAVSAVVQGRTAVIVAHRFAQAETADLIVVLEDGRVLEHGSHCVLLRRDGVYARLHAAAQHR